MPKKSKKHEVDFQQGFQLHLQEAVEENENYRQVIFTTKQTQLVMMSVSDDIHLEAHKKTTQFIYVVKGKGLATIAGEQYALKKGDALVIPEGRKHYVKNAGKSPLKLFTLYSPPEHDPQLQQITNPDK